MIILKFIYNFFFVLGIWYLINIAFYVLFNIGLRIIYKSKLEFSKETPFGDRLCFTINSIYKLYKYCKFGDNKV